MGCWEKLSLTLKVVDFAYCAFSPHDIYVHSFYEKSCISYDHGIVASNQNYLLQSGMSRRESADWINWLVSSSKRYSPKSCLKSKFNFLWLMAVASFYRLKSLNKVSSKRIELRFTGQYNILCSKSHTICIISCIIH